MDRSAHWRTWTGVVLLSTALLIGPNVRAAVRAEPPAGSESWRQRLSELGLVRGRTDTGLALDEPVSRAEFVTLIVRAFGKEEWSLTGSESFSDAQQHWASGYVAVAKGLAQQRGATIGMPDGTFRPEAPLTGPETVAFLMKFVRVAPAPDLSWPESYLKGAEDARLIGVEDLAALRELGNQPVTRGQAFYLADWVFYHHKLPDGSTVYTAYVDTVTPTLTIDSFKVDILAKQATVTGITSGEFARVRAGSVEVLAVLNEGRYTATLSWDPEQPVTILVTASDLAGNLAEQSIEHSR